jgi:hypothetical protein
MSPNPTWIHTHTSSPRRNVISHWSIHTSIMFSRTPCPFRGIFGHTNYWAQTWTYIWYWIVVQMCVPILTHTHIYIVLAKTTLGAPIFSSRNKYWVACTFLGNHLIFVCFPRQLSFSFYQFMVIFNYSYYIFSAWLRSERFQGLG